MYLNYLESKIVKPIDTGLSNIFMWSQTKVSLLKLLIIVDFFQQCLINEIF